MIFCKKNKLNFQDKKVALSHGDNFLNFKYELFCKVIRNSFLLWFLNFIDINFFISKRIEKALLSKNICHKISNFEKIAETRVKNYSSNIVIEGHYHQGNRYTFENKEYINIPSLCCQKSYTVFENKEFLNRNLF